MDIIVVPRPGLGDLGRALDDREGEVTPELGDVARGGDMHDDPEMLNLPPSGEAAEAVGQWRVAKCLLKLRAQVDVLAPDRRTASDGTIGDVHHCGSTSSTSDHCPRIVSGGVGVVAAMDITHDPGRGCDAAALAASLHASRDPRIKYIIWNRLIANSSAIGLSPPWAWRPYNGLNPHDRHVHLSVKAEAALFDSEDAWAVALQESSPAAPPNAGAQGSYGRPTWETALSFIEPAQLRPAAEVGQDLPVAPRLDLDRLPPGLVAGNTLIDLSAVPSGEVRSGVSLAMLFASRYADSAMRDGDDEDDWLAAYLTAMGKLGFAVTQSAPVRSRFKKEGVQVHKAIIPFLTIALGGAAVGPVILAALKGLGEMNKDDPWIVLFDRHSRKFSVREMHFAAASADATRTSIRHVVARLGFVEERTQVLFANTSDFQAEFESATTTMSADNVLLSVAEPQLRRKLEEGISSFIAETRVGTG